jgi:hypothetical protein
VHLALWHAALRLASLVVAAFVLVSMGLLQGGPVGAVPIVSGSVAVAFFTGATVSLARARRLLREGIVPGPSQIATARASHVYRANARPAEDDTDAARGARELHEANVARQAAHAFLMLALSGALAVVTAAAR